MKNEDRIVELLAEMLIKQDRHDELLAKIVDGQVTNNQVLEKHEKLLEKLVDGQLKTNEILRSHNERLASLEKGVSDLKKEQHTTNQRLESLENKFDKLFTVISDDVLSRIARIEKHVGL